MNEYYKISFGEVLDNHGVIITDDLVSDLISVAEMKSEYSGVSEQTKGGKSEIDILKERIQKMQKDSDNTLLNIRSNYAKSINRDISDVIILDGKILVQQYYSK